MKNYFDEFLSHTYSDTKSEVNPVENFKNGNYEVYLPLKFQTEPSGTWEEINSWAFDRKTEFYLYYHGPLAEFKISTGLNFLEYHYQKYVEKHATGLDFLVHLIEYMDELTDGKKARIDVFKRWIEQKKQNLDLYSIDPKELGPKPSEKIKWKASPAIFGYLMDELVKKGYIEPPLYAGETNITGLANLCFQYFDVKKTTLENLKKELNPNKCTLSDTKRAKFTIPDLSDLA